MQHSKPRQSNPIHGDLIPGLPEELVLAHVIPWLPWHMRPVCRAISKSWKLKLDAKNPELERRTREMQLPLLRGVFLICTFDARIFIRDNAENEEGGSYAVKWREDAYRMCRQWRELPPLQGLIPAPWASLVASSGMVYAWFNEGPWSSDEPKFVLKMDIGGGQWRWSKFSVPYALNLDAVHFNGKIYVPGASTAGDAPYVVMVYDMMRDTCEQAQAWYRDNLWVLTQGSQSEAMYTFGGNDDLGSARTLELLVFDACNDSWKTQEEEVPIPKCRWPELLNGECFEPASDLGTNIVWIDNAGRVISWFNSSLGKYWVEFDYSPSPEGKHLEYMKLIRGSLYGIFREEEKEEETKAEGEGEAEGSSLPKRTMMKGRISVERSIVLWEEMFEVGFFRKKYNLRPLVVSPIDCYTVMA